MKVFPEKFICLLLAVVLTVIAVGCSKDQVSSDVLLTAAVECAHNGNWQACEANSVAVLKRDPANEHALLLRSLASEHLGKMEIALESARQAAENAPENFAAQYCYGRLLSFKPDEAKNAIKVLERALKLRPGNRNTLILLGKCSSRINDDKAINYYLALPAAVQNRPEIQTCMAIYYLDRRDRNPGNLKLAERALYNAYRASSYNPAIVLNAALFIDYYQNNLRHAAGYYRRYLRLTEHNPELNPVKAQIKARISSVR